jgi:hypothetical protein
MSSKSSGPVSLRIIPSKPVLLPTPIVRPPTQPIDIAELSRLLKRSSFLLDCCLWKFGAEGVVKILTADTIAALPQMIETLQELWFEENAALEGRPVTYLDYQTDQGSD